VPNRLIHETSPYLLQHADNPVDWYPWGTEALEKARLEERPIFLSVGYAACHWCHVMAHESFEDPRIAELLNREFVPIKVDREERPDLDSIYMNALVAMTGQGGWPMSLFLTPDGEPFYAGTYFPPVPRYGMPSFGDVLMQLAAAWKNDREKIERIGRDVAQHLRESTQWSVKPQALQPSAIHQASETLVLSYDWEHGGWGNAPRFPQPMSIEFLLRQATRGDTAALQAAEHALTTMARGGMYDVVGGGFHRYSTDDDWLVPHFEKMLYDNALLSRAYLHAYRLTAKPFYRRIAEETLDFILREMAAPEGGFYSSLDADSEGEEGRYYLWTIDEIRSALADEKAFDLLQTAYNLPEQGNFDGRVILQRAVGDPELAVRFQIPVEQVPARMRELHNRLQKERARRVRPATDDKVLVAWNALAILSLAEAGFVLERSDYLSAAERAADFLLAALHPNARLLRSWRAGYARHDACLEDYAGLIVSLLELYRASPKVRWYAAAVELANEMLAHYADPQGGFFDVRDDADPLLARPKDIQDNATPSGNAQAAYALLLLEAYGEPGEWRGQAEAMLGTAMPLAVRYPTAFGHWLSAIDFAIGPVCQIAILGQPDDPRTQALHRVANKHFLPRSVLAVSPYPPESGSPRLLDERPLIGGLPSAYVCENFVCRQPVNDPQELVEQLERPYDPSRGSVT